MNPSFDSNRVDMTDYHALTEALRRDAYSAAIAIREALYVLKKESAFYNFQATQPLEDALSALDFPQFIPIDNTLQDIKDEYELADELFWIAINSDDYESAERYAVMCEDLESHLKTRGHDVRKSRIKTQTLPAVSDDDDSTQKLPPLPDVRDDEGGA